MVDHFDDHLICVWTLFLEEVVLIDLPWFATNDATYTSASFQPITALTFAYASITQPVTSLLQHQYPPIDLSMPKFAATSIIYATSEAFKINFGLFLNFHDNSQYYYLKNNSASFVTKEYCSLTVEIDFVILGFG